MDNVPWGNRYAALLESAGDGILIVDFDSARFLEANQAFCDMIGYGMAELREMTGRHLHPDTEGALIDGLSRGLIEVGRALCPKIRFQRKDGSLFWGAIRSTCYEDDGKKLYVAVVRDVTKRIEREEELAAAYARLQQTHDKLLHSGKLAAIGELAAGVAHEINNPAAFVQLNLESVRRSLARLQHTRRDPHLIRVLEDVDEALEESEQGIARVAAIVRSLRQFTTPDKGVIREVCLSDVVEHACAMAHTEIRHRARLTKNLASLPTIAGESGQLTQVVLNLLVNAAESIPEGEASDHEVRVTTRVNEGEIILSVRDTGSGISPSVRGRLFDPFVTTKVGGGQGLGLSLCADIVRRHGGRIEIARTEGSGAQFDVILPVDTGLRVTPSDDPEAAEELRARARILIIDDEVSLLNAYRRALSRNHDVVLTSSGAQALATFAEDTNFDVVLCDLMMPEMDGISFYETMAQEHPELSERVVFCTGGAFTVRCAEFLEGTDKRCLDKPVDLATLEALFAEMLDR